MRSMLFILRAKAFPSNTPLGISLRQFTPLLLSTAGKGQSLQESLKEFAEITSWDVKKTAAAVSKMGFPRIAENFVRHKVDGALLSEIGKAELVQMGVLVVGDRMLFIQEIRRIQKMARQAEMNKVLWKGHEYRRAPCADMLPYKFPCCCCYGPPEEYTLKAGKLQMKVTDFEIPFCGTLCGYIEALNNTDLTNIRDVDSFRVQPCILDCTETAQASVSITLDDASQLQLILKGDECDKVVDEILEAVEANQLREEARMAVMA